MWNLKTQTLKNGKCWLPGMEGRGERTDVVKNTNE